MEATDVKLLTTGIFFKTDTQGYRTLASKKADEGENHCLERNLKRSEISSKWH